MMNIFSCACLLSAEHEVFKKSLHLNQTRAVSQKLYLEIFIREVSAAILSNFSSVQLNWTVWLFLCDPMDCSMPGLSVHYELMEIAQTHAHWVGDAIQPSHPLSSHSPVAFNLSQHQGLFSNKSAIASGGQSIGASASASVLPKNIQS